MLARNPKSKKWDTEREQRLARLHAARVKRTRKRKKNGIINLRGDVDLVSVENFLEELGPGFLPPRVEHSKIDIEKAFWKYIRFMLNPEA